MNDQTQQAPYVESTCNWGRKLVDTCSTKNAGVFHVDFFMCIIGVDVHVNIKWSLRLIFFSRVIHAAFLVWIISVHFQVYFTWIVSRRLMVYLFTWISDGYHVKNATWFCLTCFSCVFFIWIIGVPIHVYICWISSEVWVLYFFSCRTNPRCISHVAYWCTFSGVFHVNCFTWIISVPIHVDIRWISCEKCHLITCFLCVFFTWIIGAPIHVYIWWISCDVWA